MEYFPVAHFLIKLSQWQLQEHTKRDFLGTTEKRKNVQSKQ